MFLTILIFILKVAVALIVGLLGLALLEKIFVGGGRLLWPVRPVVFRFASPLAWAVSRFILSGAPDGFVSRNHVFLSKNGTHKGIKINIEEGSIVDESKGTLTALSWIDHALILRAVRLHDQDKAERDANAVFDLATDCANKAVERHREKSRAQTESRLKALRDRAEVLVSKRSSTPTVITYTSTGTDPHGRDN